MEPTTFAEVAVQVAAIGVIGMIGMVLAVLNAFALRVVPPDVPGYLQARVRWWHAHNRTFLLASAAVTLAGLAGVTVA